MRAKLIDLEFTYTGKQRLVVELDGDYRDKFDQLHEKPIELDIKPVSKRRSLSANAYFHLLCGKIAEEKARQGVYESNSDVKKHLVSEYGFLAKDEHNRTIGFKLPIDVNVDEIYPYTRKFDVREENGKQFACYLVYKRTRNLTSSEMCRLIEGAIYEAHELGIETDTPDEVRRMEEVWKNDAPIRNV